MIQRTGAIGDEARWRAGAVAKTLAAFSLVAVSLSVIGGSAPAAPIAHVSSACPWVRASQLHQLTPGILADQVVARMTPRELANFVVLNQVGAMENINVAVPRLCIPALTLVDGPNGVGGNATGVTQFPSEISLAATFNPSITRDVGKAMGQETATKGIDVLQGPDLNLVRSPLSGRAFETYGEDPLLASVMGVAAIEGIQSTGVMAQAKHLGAYTQENGRSRLNQSVTSRVASEIYDAPFKAAVTQGHVASLMCAMGQVNGVNTCSTASRYASLAAWGFNGFVRSDYAAVDAPAPAFRAGMSLIKPATAAQITTLVTKGQLATSTLRAAVQRVLTQMFAYGLIAHPRTLRLSAPASNRAHVTTALQAARQSIVLLQNSGHVLPLATTLRSVAVIGVGAYDAVVTRGGGSSGVHATSLTTPLAALRSLLPHTRVSYSPGGLATLEYDPLAAADIIGGKAPPSELPIVAPGEPGTADLAIDNAKTVTAAALTASAPGTGEGWSSWEVTFVAKATGTYVVGLQDVGDTWLALNGRVILADRGIHGPYPLSTAVTLTRGATYKVVARWFSLSPSATPRFGIDYVQPQINSAVAAARTAQVAVVFAANLLTEGADTPSLALQGDLNALIEAVAAVNAHTVVVLNTGGPVLTPWRSHVAGIVEAWYPGQQGAQAMAQVLTGVVDATGRLPVTLPTSDAATPAATPSQFPGQRGLVNFAGLADIGYRWYEANNVTPAFAFGYGLSYSTYAWSHVAIARAVTGVRVQLQVTNTGARTGVDVVEVYVSYPGGVGEPAGQLRGFARVELPARATRPVVITLPESAFTYDRNGAMVVATGTYRIDVASSARDVIASQLLTLR